LLVTIEAEGASEARGEMEGMQKATQKAGNEAKRQVPGLEKMSKRWASVLSLVAASGAVAFGIITRSSPSVIASLKGIQFAFEEIFMYIGEELSPIFESFESLMFRVADAFDKLPGPVKTFIAGLVGAVAIVGALAAGFLALTIVGPIVAGALGTIAVALGISIGGILLIVGALIVAIALLYTAWKHNFGGIRDFVSFTVTRIKENWKSLMSILTDDNLSAWEKVVGVVKWASDSIKSAMMDSFKIAYDYIIGKIGVLSSTLSALAAKIKSVFSSSSSSSSSGGGTQVAAGQTVKARAFSGRASGGSVLSGTSYIVGEQGPEMFTPRLSGSITPNTQTKQNVSSGGNNKPIELNAKIDVKLDGRTIWQSIQKFQTAELRRNGVF
jgi:hypothetical protein